MFRFTIRDLLWLMVVVSIGCGWWVNWSNAEKHRQATLAVERFFMNAAVEWAKEKDEPVVFYTGRHHMRAETNGVVSVLGEGELP
jgi:hypothetical protein